MATSEERWIESLRAHRSRAARLLALIGFVLALALPRTRAQFRYPRRAGGALRSRSSGGDSCTPASPDPAGCARSASPALASCSVGLPAILSTIVVDVVRVTAGAQLPEPPLLLSFDRPLLLGKASGLFVLVAIGVAMVVT